MEKQEQTVELKVAEPAMTNDVPMEVRNQLNLESKLVAA